MTNTVQEWRFGRTDDFPVGPWSNEPDKLHWIDEATDLDCLIVRNHSGALCGYVGLPPTHPLHGKGYSECVSEDCADEWCYQHSPDGLVTVHGGLTFSSSCNESNPDGICHVPAAGRPKDVWWFGFDCAHSGDLDPLSLKYDSILSRDAAYRDVAYVKAECVSLAKQLATTA